MTMNQALANPLIKRLVNSGALSNDVASQIQTEDNQAKVVQQLIKLGQVSDVDLCSAISAEYQFERLQPEDLPAIAEPLYLSLSDFFFQHELLPLTQSGEQLRVAMSNPLDEFVMRVLKAKLHRDIVPVVALRSEILSTLSQLYRRPSRVGQQTLSAKNDDTNHASPLVAELNGLLHTAIRQSASDIHFEPDNGGLRVRFRIDGLLQNKHQFTLDVSDQVVSRLKLMADLDVSERRQPQDGRFSFNAEGNNVDVRVATLPLQKGESIVLRLLAFDVHARSLEDLGFDPNLAKQVTQASQQQSGIFLVTGPTGSGKSTTLYSLLQSLNDTERKLISIEDPVEMNVAGVNQIQINEQFGITFANSLRAVLRQDPDIIMVGEIRDAETAQLAVQAALTGHLVLSTLHTDSALRSIRRLQDLGISDTLIHATVVGVVAQRLLRLCCQHDNCEARCPHCFGTGYKGRTAVAEFLGLNNESDSLFDITQIEMTKSQLFERLTMLDRARQLVSDGLTDEAEVTRVFGLINH